MSDRLQTARVLCAKRYDGLQMASSKNGMGLEVGRMKPGHDP